MTVKMHATTAINFSSIVLIWLKLNIIWNICDTSVLATIGNSNELVNAATATSTKYLNLNSSNSSNLVSNIGTSIGKFLFPLLLLIWAL